MRETSGHIWKRAYNWVHWHGTTLKSVTPSYGWSSRVSKKGGSELSNNLPLLLPHGGRNVTSSFRPLPLCLPCHDGWFSWTWAQTSTSFLKSPWLKCLVTARKAMNIVVRWHKSSEMNLPVRDDICPTSGLAREKGTLSGWKMSEVHLAAVAHADSLEPCIFMCW